MYICISGIPGKGQPQEHMENIKLFYIPKEEVERTRSVLTNEWKNTKRIMNLLSLHHFEVVSTNKLQCAPTSESKNITMYTFH